MTQSASRTRKHGVPRHEPTTRRVLDVRLLLISLGVVAALTAAAHFWKQYQVGRTAGAMLQRAETLAQQGEVGAASGYLYRYLQLHPDDPRANRRLAELMLDGARDIEARTRAADACYAALAKLPLEQRPALRARLGQLLIELERYGAAEKEAALLAAEASELADAEARRSALAQSKRLAALAIYGRIHTTGRVDSPEAAGVAGQFEASLEQLPGDVTLATTLARIWRDEPTLLAPDDQQLAPDQRAARADQIIDRMVAHHRQGVEALLARAAYRAAYGQAGAEADLREALRRERENLHVLLSLAEHERRATLAAQRDGRWGEAAERCEQARRSYQQVIDRGPEQRAQRRLPVLPEELAAHDGLARLLAMRGQLDRAVAVCRSGLALAPEQAILLRFLLAELLLAEGSLDAMAEQLDALDEQLRQLLPLATRSPDLQAEHRSMQGDAALLRAKWHLAKNDPAKAVGLLQTATLGPEGTPRELARRLESCRLLGRAHAALGDWQMAAKAFEDAVGLAPRAADLALAAAEAHSRAGNHEKAVLLARRALLLDPAPAGRLALARLLLRREAARPAEARAFDEVRQALAETAAVGSAGQPAAGQLSAARQWLEAQLAALEAGDGLAPADTIDRSAGALGFQSRTDASRLRAFWDDVQVTRELAPKNAGLLTLMAEVGLAARIAARWTNDAPAAAQWDASLERVEEALRSFQPATERSEPIAPDAIAWRYYRARRLLVASQGPDDPRLSEATELIRAIDVARPRWSVRHVLAGQIHEAREQADQAVEAYAAALRDGANDTFACERLVATLRSSGRLGADVGELLDPISDAAACGRLGRAMLRQADEPGLAELERQRLREMGRGELETALRLTTETTRRFEIVELLAADHAAHDGPDEAKTAIDRLCEDTTLSPAQRALLLARRHEWFGELEDARDAYRRAAELGADDDHVLMQCAGYLLRAGRLDAIAEAESLLARLVERSPHFAPARQALALVLAARGDDAKWQEAQSLLNRPEDADDDASASGRRLLAMLLLQRGGKEHRVRARELLEQLIARGSDSIDGDRLLLAGLYEQDQMIHAAEEQYRALVERSRPAPRVLAEYVAFLLRRGQSDRAAVWLDRLEAAAPDQWRTAALRARWFYARQETARIEPLLEPAAKRWLEAIETGHTGAPRRAAVAHDVGRTYLDLGCWDAAERWLRLAAETASVATDPTQSNPPSDSTKPPTLVPSPAHVQAYIEFLLDRDQHEKAGPWIDQLKQLAPRRLGTLAVESRWLRSCGREGEIEQAVEPVAENLYQSVAADPAEQARLALAVGDLYLRVKRNEAAERWFRRAGQSAPGIQEGVAIALARQGRHADAVRLCIELGARQPEDAARPGEPPLLHAARLACGALLEGTPSPDDFAQVEPLLARALSQHPDDIALLFGVAGVRIVERRVEDAIRLYQRLIELRPDHVLALNNLATLLGDIPQRREEALHYVDQALRAAGPMPGLLDTKGTILLRGGETAEVRDALELLETASKSPNPDPRYFFHLAEAYWRLGRLDDAKQSFEEARRRGLTSQVLTEVDLRNLASLETALAP